MFDRFTHESRVFRGKIPRKMRHDIFKRDNFTCIFCGFPFAEVELTIDHLIPLALGGLDEMTNYVSSCGPCNQAKGCIPLHEFAKELGLSIRDLPIHGDQILNNDRIPPSVHKIRRHIFERMRASTLKISGKSAQRKIEKIYRTQLWQTPIGRHLETEAPQLPGHVRASLIEIRTIARTAEDYLLMVELAKSANTRNLIGTLLTANVDITARLREYRSRCTDVFLNKRIDQAFVRFDKERRRVGASK